MKMTYRKAGLGDEDAIALVGAATFLESFSGQIDGQGLVRHCAEKHDASTYLKALKTPGHAIWLAELAPGAAPVGYLHLTPPDLPIKTRPDDVEVKRIYLLGKMQGHQVGRKLMALAIAYAREVGAGRVLLGVHDGNETAMGFYERLGFERIGERDFDVGGVTYHDWIYALEL